MAGLSSTAGAVGAADTTRSFVPDEYAWLLVMSFIFGFANAISHGRWQPISFALLMVGLAVFAWRFVAASRTPADAEPTIAPRLTVGALFAMLLSMPVTAFFDPTILAQPAHPMTAVRVAQVASLLLIASYAPFLSGRRQESERLRTARFVAFALVLLFAGVAVIHITPSPGIDVWTIEMKGGEVLLDGKNPYVWATVPDTDPQSDFTVPFVYPPAAAYLAAVGIAVFGDIRYMLLGGMFAAGLALRFIARRASARSGRAVPSILEDAPALFFWQTPMLVMVVELSWIDPLQLMLICGGLAAYVADRRTLAAIAFGIAVSSKQTMFWVFPLAALVLRFDLRRWIVMGLSALVPVLPFMVWDFKALKHANFDFMTTLPARHDALCFTNAVWKWSHATFPHVVGFLLAAVLVAVACGRALAGRFRLLAVLAPAASRPILDFALALALTYFVFFFFNRWAFANYYFLLTGLAALGAAAALHRAVSAEGCVAAPRRTTP
ncbi:MAG TPA: hypothetical protein VM925_24755 [Labilithrix sp.]|nr:hypothetical protein [Labilithrix sp.]